MTVMNANRHLRWCLNQNRNTVIAYQETLDYLVDCAPMVAAIPSAIVLPK